MAKSIIDIELNDAAFTKFLGAFSEYSQILDEHPEMWEKVGGFIDEAAQATHGLRAGSVSVKEALALAGAQASIISAELRGATHAQDALGVATGKSAKRMTEAQKAAKGLGSELFGIGKWLLKLGTIGFGLAVGGAFGLDALAGSILARTRTGGQLGLSPAQVASFQTNAQQFLGVNALQSAAEAQVDITKGGYLAALGIDMGRARRMSAADLAFEELKAAARGFKSATPGTEMQNPAVMSYLALGGSIGDVRNAANNPLALARAQRNYQHDISGMGIQDPQAWIDFRIQMDRATREVEAFAANALTPVIPELIDFSKQVVSLTASVLESKDLGIFLRDLATETKLLVDDVKVTAGNLEKAGQGIHDWLVRFHIIPDDKTNQDNGSPKWNPFDPKTWSEEEKAKRNKALWDTWHNVGPQAKQPATGRAGALGDLAKGVWNWLGKGANADSAATIANVAEAFGVDPLTALASSSVETGRTFNPRAVGDKGTSFGLFQLHRGGELGDMTPEQAFDPQTNARTALSEFARLAKLHPDWSPGRLAAEAQRPADKADYERKVNAEYNRFRNAAPKGIDQHTDRIVKALNRRTAAPKVQLAITNDTASRIAVSANALMAT